MEDKEPPPAPPLAPALSPKTSTPTRRIQLRVLRPLRFEKVKVLADSRSENFKLGLVTEGLGTGTAERVVVYRYGNGHVPESFTSRRRLDNITEPPVDELDLNAILNSHTHRVPPDSPFVSIILDYDKLYQVSEPQARESIETAFHLIEFHVPMDSLYRPTICSAATRSETEWCVLDYPAPVSSFMTRYRANPYGKMRMFRLLLKLDANKQGSGVRASLNRNPQFVRVDIGGEYPVPAYHWAWEKGDLLRVEAASALEHMAVKIFPKVHFKDPPFELDIIKIIPI
jgi:hypothetical protein